MATQVSLIKGGKSIFSFIIISRPKKIVHLVRDPRFQEQSRLRNRFPCESGNLTGYCQGYEGSLLYHSNQFMKNKLTKIFHF